MLLANKLHEFGQRAFEMPVALALVGLHEISVIV